MGPLLGLGEVCHGLEAQLAEEHCRLHKVEVVLCSRVEAPCPGGQASPGAQRAKSKVEAAVQEAPGRTCLPHNTHKRDRKKGHGLEDAAPLEVSSSPLVWLFPEKGAWLWELLGMDPLETVLGPLKVQK